MRQARIFFRGEPAGILKELERGKSYRFEYDESYGGAGISLAMPPSLKIYPFDSFPPFFDGLLPEGPQLEALLRQAKLDRADLFGQLITVGADLIGAVTAEEIS
ncbi:MAG: HipA N-terminal domain-containing protein [Deltaproteobacteria bacterium]|nr:HipA N-terminal domain-containing protein [Deltaproteobacteria bacterium]